MKGELADYSIRFAIRVVNYYKWLTEEKKRICYGSSNPQKRNKYRRKYP